MFSVPEYGAIWMKDKQLDVRSVNSQHWQRHGEVRHGGYCYHLDAMLLQLYRKARCSAQVQHWHGGLTQLRYYSTVVFSVTHSNRHWPAWGPILFFRSKAEGLFGGQFEAERGGLSGGWTSSGGGGAAVGGGQRKSEESGVGPIHTGDHSGQQPSGHTNGVCTTAGPSDWTSFNTQHPSVV